MANDPVLTKYQDIPCCPDLDTAPICDVLDFRRHLIFPTAVRTERGQMAAVFHRRRFLSGRQGEMEPAAIR